MKFEPIAIIGSGCILPGCSNPAELWQMVNTNVVNITEVANDYWQVDLTKIVTEKTAAVMNDHTYSTYGGYVRDFNQVFDPTQYNVPAELLLQLDPVVQWSCYAAKQALAQAGYDSITKLNKRAGIILGNLSYPSLALSQLFANTYLRDIFPKQIPANSPHWLNRFGSGYPAMLTAQALNFGGIAFCIDAACASSLYAIKLACDQLQNKQHDLMLAGGVCASDSLFIHVGFSALNAMDPHGRSRPFHQDAAGLVPGEGAGVLVLKRLADAINNNDKILGIIRGIGLSNDGRSKNLLTPANHGQISSMQTAFTVSGIKPADITYIECHATGTQIGDGTEIESMRHIFKDLSNIALGSLKANVGHLITASGVAGIIKVIYAMQQNCIPATPNAYPVQMSLHHSPFYVPMENRQWNTKEMVKLACINSFGFGGNNACLILQDGQSVQQLGINSRKKPTKRNKVAIVALEIRTHHAKTMTEFFKQLITSANLANAATTELNSSSLDIKQLAFLPKELQKALGQQIILLDLCEQLLARTHLSSPEQTGVYIGMGVDPNVSRYGLRYRLQTILSRYGITVNEEWIKQASEGVIAAMESGHVLGAMPNMPANRLNYQHACEGPGFTVSAEELSGDVALQLAVNAIQNREINTALVGAVEVIADKVHTQAIQKLLANNTLTIGEAAVVLLLKDYDLALRDGDEILAIVDGAIKKNNELINNTVQESPLYKMGVHYCHAATGLLHIAAATLLVAHKAAFINANNLLTLVPILDNKQVNYTVQNESLFGANLSVSLKHTTKKSVLDFSLSEFPQLITYCGDDRQTLLQKIKQNIKCQPEESGKLRLAIVGYASEIAELNRQAIYQLENNLLRNGLNYKGLYYREKPLTGQLAFVYTGAASCYPAMGRELLLTLPNLVDYLTETAGDIYPYIDWLYKADDFRSTLPFYQLSAASFLCQIHTIITRQLFKLTPDAAIGLSSGETNYMFALGIWQGLKDLLEKIADSGLYTEHLGNQFTAVKQYWQMPTDQPVNWTSWHIVGPVVDIKRLIAKEPKVFLTIIYTANDCVIAGDTHACERIINQIGRQAALPLPHDLAIHCAAIEPFAPTWRALHTRAVTPVNIKCYSNFFGDSYTLTSAAVAQALTGQAINTVDFPNLINKAWQDGVRIFIEHGPKNNLTRAIHTILQDKPHLAVAMDNANDSFKQLYDVMAQLWCAGVAVDVESLSGEYMRILAKDNHPRMEFPLHLSPISFPALITTPAELPIFDLAETMPEPIATANTSIRQFKINTVADFHTQYTALYQHALACQQHMFAEHSALQKQMAGVLFKRRIMQSKQLLQTTTQQISNRSLKNYPGPAFTRQDLEILASGKISTIFGPMFKQQDAYEIQCRMPEPPLLLCDRVLGIEGEPGSLGFGKVWTETDIKPDSWFIHYNRIAPGMMIEAGQADLLLISWLGIDFLNQGTRAYRLLGCELNYRKPLPKIGDTLRYEITITNHAHHGDVRLFFFEYDCYVKDEIVMSVRHGQAGFFSPEELKNSAGVIWDPEQADYISKPKLQLPKQWPIKNNYPKAALMAYTKGDMVTCFGEHFFLTETHTRTPISLLGTVYLLEEVDVFDVQGGPKGRGYMRATTRVKPNDWYFQGHFKNDPCMPGTLMAEAGMQAMAFYLTALGCTLNKDGWRFEPLMDSKFNFICRGQAIPSSDFITYELFIEEIIMENYPTLIAYVLGSVDGQKAFLGEHLALRLVPDWPVSSKPELLENCRKLQANYIGPIASLNNFKFDYESLIHSAWGKPSDAFGPVFHFYDDGLHRCPHLPGPPYHFMSRIIALDAEFGNPKVGAKIVSEYDIPVDAWYFSKNAFPTMSYAVIMEIALQPCGWFSIFTQYNELKKLGEALFRNLDGEAKLYREITPVDKTIRIEIKLLGLSQIGSTIIVKYDVLCTIAEQIVYQLKTSFGFFAPAVFADQKGIAIDEHDRTKRNLPDNSSIEINLAKTIDDQRTILGLPKPGLLMLDRVTGYWPDLGKFNKGLIRAQKIVKPSNWYFKAHFFQDPVQPGSLGIEAMLQLLQFYMLYKRYDQYFTNPHFEPVAINETIEWHYRGQVTPYDNEIIIELDIVTEERGHSSYTVKAEGVLWLNNLKIYSAPQLVVRLIE